MSIIVAWAGRDNHGTTSAYIVADSRVSWAGKKEKYDACRKVFCSKKYPEIIGYCGDVLFPSIVINQIVEIIDSGLFFHSEDDCRKRFDVFKNKLISEFEKYPQDSLITSDAFEVVYINREIGSKNYLSFNCYSISWSRTRKWKVRTILMPVTSGVLIVFGSGREYFNLVHDKVLQKSKNGTSRAIFHSFIQTLTTTSDDTYSGPPQLVGLYRMPGSCGRNYGIIFNRKRYILGTQVKRAKNCDVIEWRNKYFEICNGNSKQKLTGAANQQYSL